MSQRLRELLWKTHRPLCKAVHEDAPCDCGAVDGDPSAFDWESERERYIAKAKAAGKWRGE